MVELELTLAQLQQAKPSAEASHPVAHRASLAQAAGAVVEGVALPRGAVEPERDSCWGPPGIGDRHSPSMSDLTLVVQGMTGVIAPADCPRSESVSAS